MAVGALVKAREWKEWLEYWRHLPKPRSGLERFVVDLLTLGITACLRDARLVRQGMLRAQHDHRDYSDDELHDPVEAAERDLAFFERHLPEVSKGATPELAFMLKVLGGILKTRILNAREFRQAMRKGYVTVNVSPHRRDRHDFDGVEEL